MSGAPSLVNGQTELSTANLQPSYATHWRMVQQSVCGRLRRCKLFLALRRFEYSDLR